MADQLRRWGHIGIDEWPRYLQDAIDRSGAKLTSHGGHRAEGRTEVSQMTYTLDLEPYRPGLAEWHGAMRVRARVSSSAAMASDAAHALVDCEERVEALRSIMRAEALLSVYTVWRSQVRCNTCKGRGKNGRGDVCAKCEGRGWEREVKRS